MAWQPLNLTEVCPAHTQLTACTYFGLYFLDLLVKLFGDSEDRRIQEKIRRNGYKLKDKKESETENEEYDFIVVGAGAAGCVVANRLTEIKDWKVLLLEAGPEEPDITLSPGLSTVLRGSNIDWQFSTEPDSNSCLARPGGRCAWSSGKTMGGSTSINSMVYVRGNKLDYDTWASMGNEGWSYEDVLPFFKKSEKNLNMEGLNRKYHGVRGPQSVSRYPFIDRPSIMMTEAFNEAGLPILDFNGEQQVGTMQAQTFSEDGKRVSTNKAFIQPIRYKRKNLTVKTNSEAVEILIDKYKRANGVKYVRNGKMHTAVARKEVIISAGVINSPKLLMLSGIGPKKQLDHLNIPVVEDLPVGENLQDHITFTGIGILLPNKTAATVDNEGILNFAEEYKKSELKNGPLSANGLVNSLAFTKTEPYLPAPDIQFQMNGINCQDYYREPTTYEQVIIFPTSFYDCAMSQTIMLVPKSRGKLVLNTTNPNGPPVIYANYFRNPEDLVSMVKGAKFIISLETSKAFISRGAQFIKIRLPACKNFIWGSDKYIECLARSYTATAYHPAGTCKMGPNWDKTAVVDPRLRVYGISGLRVIDASIMPVVPRGNTNAPSIMVGEKGVELVKEDWLHNYLPRM